MARSLVVAAGKLMQDFTDTRAAGLLQMDVDEFVRDEHYFVDLDSCANDSELNCINISVLTSFSTCFIASIGSLSNPTNRLPELIIQAHSQS